MKTFDYIEDEEDPLREEVLIRFNGKIFCQVELISSESLTISGYGWLIKPDKGSFSINNEIQVICPEMGCISEFEYDGDSFCLANENGKIGLFILES